MGIPLKEQLNNPHPKATKGCEGCHQSGWLSCHVDDLTRMEEAKITEPADFLMRCGECEVFPSDVEAAVAARKSGMKVNEHLVVAYTDEQLAFLAIEPIEDPKLWLIHQLGGLLEGLHEVEEHPQILNVSCDGDNTSASIIVDVLTDEGVKELLISTAGIKDVSDDDE